MSSSPVYQRVARHANVARRDTPAAPPVAAGPQASGLVEQLTSTVPARRPHLMREFLRARASKTLGLGDARAVDDHQPLRDAGLDSLLAIELRNVLGAAIGRTLPATLLFDFPTIDDLTAHLLAILFPAAPDTDDIMAASEAESPANLVDDLESMSDDDIDRLLAAKMRGRT